MDKELQSAESPIDPFIESIDFLLLIVFSKIRISIAEHIESFQIYENQIYY